MRLKEKLLSNPALFLTVSSPEELQEALFILKKEHKIKSRYIILALDDNDVLVRLFSYRNITKKELEIDLASEAADLLSIPPEDIEIDYQVLSCDDQKMEGVFICAPRKLLKGYLVQIDDVRLTPVKVTSPLLTVLDSYMVQKKHIGGRIALIDFSFEHLFHFVVLQDKQCQFLRKVKYESYDELRQSVIRTLQSSCASSHHKSFDRICLLGNIENGEVLVEAIRNAFEAEVECSDACSATVNPFLKSTFFRLNLLKKYVFSPKARTVIVLISYLFAWLILLHSIFLLIEIKGTDAIIHNTKMSFSEQDYEHAVELREKLR